MIRSAKPILNFFITVFYLFSLASAVYAADVVWVEDAIPAGAIATSDNNGGKWNWISSNPKAFGGTLAHQAGSPWTHRHGFYGAQSGLAIQPGDKLFTYVYIDARVPKEIMLEWYDGASWNHRAYWGVSVIVFGPKGTPHPYLAGPVPASGQWVRLEVPASAVGLEGKTIYGINYAIKGGYAAWDRTGKVTAASATPLTLSATATPASGVAPLTVNLGAIVSGGSNTYYTYNWNYGDGTTYGKIANPTHSYTKPGNYTVTLSVSDGKVVKSATTAIQVNPPVATPPPGNVIQVSPTNYRDQLAQLRPGDTLLFQAGDYWSGLPIQYLNGEPDKPITITGPETGPQPVFHARDCCNTVSIIDSSYVVVRNITVNGDNLPVDGVKAEGHAQWAHHITLENLLIIGHGYDQQTVAISTKCPAWNWIIRGNIINGAGTGLYLGNSDGSMPFIAGLVEYNLITESIGYNAQFKHQNLRPSLPGMPTGNNATTIRHNVFSKANSAAGTDGPRPNVLVGHWPSQGVGMEDVYQIYGNVFYQNASERLFQGEGNIAMYDNLFINTLGDAVAIQSHNGVPRHVAIFHNTVLAAGSGIAFSGANTLYRQSISANAVFAGSPLWGGVSMQENIIDSLANAGNYLIDVSGALGEINLYPKSGALQRTSFFPSDAPLFNDSDKDFNRVIRDPTYRGAYSGSGANPGWIPKLERKP